MLKRSLCQALLLLAFLASCKKSNTSHNPSDANAWVSSIQLYTPASLQRYTDSFTYDNSHRIATYRQLFYDSTYGYPHFSTWSATFTQPADGTKPPAGKIAINAFFNGTVTNSILDTMTISNGNVTGELIYQPNTAYAADDTTSRRCRRPDYLPVFLTGPISIRSMDFIFV